MISQATTRRPRLSDQLPMTSLAFSQHARAYAQFPILSADWWENSRCVFSLPLLIVSIFFVSFRFGLQVCFFIRFFLEQFIFLMTSLSVLTIHVHPFLVMSHIARGGALRDVQRVTEAMPCVASVCQGMQGVERKWRGGKRNLFFFICCSRSNFCAKKLAVQGSFFVHNIWRSFNIRVVGADLTESGLRVRNNAEGCSETTL